MSTLELLLKNNRNWAERIQSEQPGLLDRLSEGQTPHYLWIGCCDSRVPPSVILDLPPGDLFVHRNIGNVVSADDMSCSSSIQFAVNFLQVRHIIVCGHYGCGGIEISLTANTQGPMDRWLGPMRAVYEKHRTELDGINDNVRRLERFSEIHTMEQVANVCRNPVVVRAWENGLPLQVHGWMYRTASGQISDLGVSRSGK